MAASVSVRFKDVRVDERVRDHVEKRCEALAGEFPEVTRFEIIVAPDGAGHTAHGHVTGRGTDLAAQAAADDLGLAADRVLDAVGRQLRKTHDKRIFAHRREAQRRKDRDRAD